MAYITPNSDVYILKGVSLDSDYNHTLHNTSLTAQYNELIQYRKYTLNAQSYQRAGKGKIRVAILADNLYDCNYMMFKNTAYGEKWFYAFIDSVEYVNDNASEINYTIDVMQTWYFDYELGQCYVEREHTLTDVAGDNLVPENVDTGELIIHSYDDSLESKYMLGAVLLVDADIPSYYHDTIENVDYYFDCKVTWSDGAEISGTPCTGTLYYGFPMCNKDITEYWLGQRLLYEMMDFRGYYNSTPSNQPPYMTFSRFLDAVSLGKINQNITANNIACAFMYPAYMTRKDNLQSAQSLFGYRNCVAMGGGEADIYRPTNFRDNEDDANPYVPKNNKLFTYPYVQLMCSNNTGSTSQYRYENFSNPSAPVFAWVGNFALNPTMMVFPCGHRGLTYDYESSVSLSEFPTPIYSADQYAIWVQAHANRMSTSVFGASIFGILTMILGGVMHNGMIVGRGLTLAGSGFLSGVANNLGTMEDYKNLPSELRGQVGADTLNAGMNRVGFRFYNMTIKKEFARIIDDYFTMYGYATHKVKVPNIRATGVNIRPHFNYIKTLGCVIHASANKGLPADDEKKIASIYDKGVTFWNYLSEVGNYSLNNAPS